MAHALERSDDELSELFDSDADPDYVPNSNDESEPEEQAQNNPEPVPPLQEPAPGNPDEQPMDLSIFLFEI